MDSADDRRAVARSSSCSRSRCSARPIFSSYFTTTILTQSFIFGIAAASLIFLSAYGGMISLAQTALMGIAGYVLGNLVTTGGVGGESKGLDSRLGPDTRARARDRHHDRRSD